ncbi:MAG: biopolymer transporter ExbD [Prevotella sp.]|nr:biopolymer transporter ExbD [Prevotella sp.]
MAKKKESKQKKMSTRVDFTPMVDMMMLLITFFMLCTTLSKPQAMQLTMPSNDKNVTDQDRNAAKASHTITIFAAGKDKIYYIEGLPKYDDPTCLKETTWGRKGIRDVLIKHTTEEGINPVAKIMKAKQDLDELKAAGKMNDSIYNARLTQIKKGELENEKIPTMTIIIKVLDSASYKNMVDVLDEMQICSIGTYVIDKISEDDQKLLDMRGIK